MMRKPILYVLEQKRIYFMMWAIWRSKLWAVRNRWRNSSWTIRCLTLLLGGGILAGSAGGYSFLAGWFVKNDATSAKFGPVLVALVAQLFFITLIVSLRPVFYAFYQASDLTFLRVTPLPSVVIFAAKAIESSESTILPVIVGGVILTAYGQAMDFKTGYYLWSAGMVAGMSLLTTAISLATVFVAIRVFNPRRARYIILASLLFSLGAFFLCLGLLSTTTDMQFLLALFRLWGRFQTGDFIFSSIVPVGILLSGAILLGLDYGLYQRLFYNGWERVHEVSIEVGNKRKRLHFLERWAYHFPSLSGKYIIAKEWLLWARSPSRLFYLVGLPTNAVWVLTPLLIRSATLAEILMPVSWIVLSVLFIMVPLAVVTWAMDVSAGDGRNWALLRLMPVSVSDLLSGKFWGLFIPSLLSVECLTLGIMPRFGWSWWTLMALLLAAYLVFGFSVTGIAVGSLAAKLRSNLPTKVSGWGLPASLLMSLILVISTVLSILWAINFMIPAVHLSPWWRVVQMFPTLSRFLNLGWWALPMLFGINGVFWLLIAATWKAGIRRLERWEVVGEG
jgi:hypothetical protein